MVLRCMMLPGDAVARLIRAAAQTKGLESHTQAGPATHIRAQSSPTPQSHGTGPGPMATAPSLHQAPTIAPPETQTL